MYTPAECVDSYTKFWIQHRRHKDPVCYGAAIFCRMLAYWCAKFEIAIDIKLGARNMQDMQIYTKIHYMGTRKIRVLELMCLIQFLQGAHKVMLDDKTGVRKMAMTNYLEEDKAGKVNAMRHGWNRLVADWKRANAQARAQGATEPIWRLPLQWSKDACLTRVAQPIGRPISTTVRPTSTSTVTSQTAPIGQQTKGKEKK